MIVMVSRVAFEKGKKGQALPVTELSSFNLFILHSRQKSARRLVGGGVLEIRDSVATCPLWGCNARARLWT